MNRDEGPLRVPRVYFCSCGKRFDTLLLWSTHYRETMPKVKHHSELTRRELSELITVQMRRHGDHHRLSTTAA